MPGNTTSPQPRCEATHPDDASPCEGPLDAVTVLDRQGSAAGACVHHGAHLYASLVDPRVRVGSVPGAAIEVYHRAQAIPAFAWLNRRQLPTEGER
ncbi:hypothetical protein ACIBCA_11490 [Kitasatospora sp. NPDC051170]|uniref:hypothetical protein n=1 Tax=Kitasatospora sp. NPDC051170 TaxID=3364056 RepID=UPI0037A3A144